MTPANGAARVAVPLQRPALSVHAAAVVLALLLGMQPLATDLYLPALPILAQDLRATMPAVQLTMSAMVLGFGLSQLVWGPVADRAGRRPVLLAGLVLHELGAIGAALAPHIDAVIACRAVQGVGMAASVVCARAMVRDLFEPHQGAHVMSRALTGLGFFAIGAPLAGGALAAWAGWRATMAALSVLGAVMLLIVLWRVPETNHRRNPRATHWRPLLRQMGRTLAHPTFRAWTLLVCSSYATLMIFLAGSSFVLMQGLGLSAWACGLAMASSSCAYVLGTMICRRLLHRYGLTGAMLRGATFHALAGALMLIVGLGGPVNLWSLLVPQAVFALGHGVAQPCGQTGAVSPFPQAAGTASALAGFALALCAMGISLWLGAHLVGSEPQAYGLAFATLCAVTVGVTFTLVRRHGTLPPT